MACDLLGQLKDLVGQIEGGCKGPCPCPGPCRPACVCPPTVQPIATCCMVVPPPILAPTMPQPVKPLQLPCAAPCQQAPMSEEDALKTRYANYYNNYNVDWHPDSACSPKDPYIENRKNKCKGVTTFGKSPCCEDYMKKKNDGCDDKGCPTGFKPCTMKMCPPWNNHPNGVWAAQIQPCPPKPKKKVSTYYEPGPCTRPCCKHWKPKDGDCIYDQPCKAHCYNHPPGMKAKMHTV